MVYNLKAINKLTAVCTFYYDLRVDDCLKRIIDLRRLLTLI